MRNNMNWDLKLYWTFRDELAIIDGAAINKQKNHNPQQALTTGNRAAANQLHGN